MREKQGYCRTDSSAERAITVPYSFPKCAGGNLDRHSGVQQKKIKGPQKELLHVHVSIRFLSEGSVFVVCVLSFHEIYSLTLLLYSVMFDSSTFTVYLLKTLICQVSLG